LFQCITAAEYSEIAFFSQNTYMHVYSDYGTILSDMSLVLQAARSLLQRNIELYDETLLIAQMLCSEYSISVKLDRDYYYVIFRDAIRCDTLFMGTCCTDFRGIRPVDLFINIAHNINAAHPSPNLCKAV